MRACGFGGFGLGWYGDEFAREAGGGVVGGVFDGAEAGDEGGECLDVLGACGGVEEFEERVEGALVGVEDGEVVGLDGGGGHGTPLRCIFEWTVVAKYA